MEWFVLKRFLCVFLLIALGFGGKVEPNESIEQAAIRELEEESFLTAQKLAYHGNLVFTFQSRPDIMVSRICLN